MALQKKSNKQIKKAYEDYYRSLNAEELREAIESATNKLKILLNIRAERSKLELN